MTDRENLEINVSANITLHLHHYQGGDKTPALCIPGLTRNARDFEDFAPKVAETGRDVFAVSLRGRGASDYDPDYLNYHPLTYRDDILKVLDTLALERAIFIGTSLGGIVTMLTNDAAPARVAAAIINDIGPDLAPEGIERITGYVGTAKGPAADIHEAAARIKAINEVAFPDENDDFWIAFARRTFREIEGGKWELAYDMNVARALSEAGPAPDLWPAFEGLKTKPTLVIRGEISDLLTADIIDKMRAVHPSFDYAEIPRVGHAPMLTEPAAWEAIKGFLKKLD